MPIYAYRCGECGFEKDVLQKFADAPLVECPNCHKSNFSRMITAPTFQLKGTGWYVTDFRGDGRKNGASPADEGAASAGSAPTEQAASSSDTAGSGAAATDSGSSAASATTGAGDSHAS